CSSDLGTVNLVALVGRLTRDPDLRYSQSGIAVAKFSIAVDRPFNRDETDFFDIVAFRKLAELAAQHLTKGRQVGITGRLQQERWETQEGEKRSRVVVVVDELTFVGNRSESGDQSGGAEDDDWNPDDVPF